MGGTGDGWYTPMMRYLALGDSMSMDDYTGVPGGGAAAQFARLVRADDVADLTMDGCTTAGALDALRVVETPPDVVTLTAGGNDLLLCAGVAGDWCGPAVQEVIHENLLRIAGRLLRYDAVVIFNTIYDPTDGDDTLLPVLGFAPAFRAVYDAINADIRAIARHHAFRCADLEALFHGHGLIAAAHPWLVQRIEPNHAGATAIAREWARVYRR
jgi:lysophospholipase L1-like esterase